MTNRTSIHPRLHALIGDIATDVPEDLAREIECALRDQHPPVPPPRFFACLNAIRQADDADGQRCTARTLGASGQASLSRSLAGLAVLLDLLHAAERARVDSAPDEQLGAFHTDGLILAARQLVREAHHCLAGSAA